MRFDENSMLVRVTLGQNVRALREQSGASQSAFSRMVSVDRSYLNQIEAGKENVTVDILVKLADGLDVPVTELFAGLEQGAPHKLSEETVRYHAVKLQKD